MNEQSQRATRLRRAWKRLWIWPWLTLVLATYALLGLSLLALQLVAAWNAAHPESPWVAAGVLVEVAVLGSAALACLGAPIAAFVGTLVALSKPRGRRFWWALGTMAFTVVFDVVVWVVEVQPYSS
jgi:hypothetical protein